MSRTSKFLPRLRQRAVLAGLAAAVLGVSAGTAIAMAGSPGAARHDRAAGADRVAVTGTGNGVCKVGFDTQTSTLIPPDDTTADNIAAGTVTMTRNCAGPVSGLFVGEFSTPDAADFLHMDFRATCISKAGLSNACTVGQQTFASPGHTFVQSGPTAGGTRSVQMVWTGLKKGQFRFEALPGGNNSANIQFRSFVVTAYTPGS